MKYLITGGCGFLGSNIARKLIQDSNDVIIFDNLSRFGSSQNLDWLKNQGNFEFIHGDIRNTNDVDNLIINYQPDIIYHFAGQVAMTTSITNPRLDFEINVCGSFNLLNAVRLYNQNSVIIYSSTNKVYGDLNQFSYSEMEKRYVCNEMPSGFDESVNLDFQSPYGTSKGSADQYFLDFNRIYGIKTVVFRHSSMYGGRQFSTVDQGWVGWFTQKALEIKSNSNSQKFTISGNGKQVRDLLYASDCVELYLLAAKNIQKIKGQAFNIGGGILNSFSLLELFDFLEKELEIQMNFNNIAKRESDQLFFVANTEKIKSYINWTPKISKEIGVRKLINWVEKF